MFMVVVSGRASRADVKLAPARVMSRQGIVLEAVKIVWYVAFALRLFLGRGGVLRWGPPPHGMWPEKSCPGIASVYFHHPKGQGERGHIHDSAKKRGRSQR